MKASSIADELRDLRPDLQVRPAEPGESDNPGLVWFAGTEADQWMVSFDEFDFCDRQLPMSEFQSWPVRSEYNAAHILSALIER